MEENEKGVMMTMGDLPESCISHILCFTAPGDVCRLSAVNLTFRSAGNSDSVWEKMLPNQYPYLLARLDSPLEIYSKKELYFAVCHPNWIDGRTKVKGVLCFISLYFRCCRWLVGLIGAWFIGCFFWFFLWIKGRELPPFWYLPKSPDTGIRGFENQIWDMKFWIEQATGKLCFMLSARNLNITWGDDDRYWHWVSKDESSLNEIAELVSVCWFEVTGSFDCKLLSPGAAYSVSFRLKVHESPRGIIRFFSLRTFIPPMSRAYGWNCKPVKFSLTTPCGDHQIYARYLSDMNQPVETEGYQMAPFRHVEEGWMEFDAGRFVVEEKGDNPGNIEFCMREWEGGNWKGGLLLEGVTILPISLVRGRAE